MTIKKGNKSLTVTLNPWHWEKLKKVSRKTNLSSTGIIRRLLEGSDMVWEQVKK